MKQKKEMRNLSIRLDRDKYDAWFETAEEIGLDGAKYGRMVIMREMDKKIVYGALKGER